MFRKIVEAAKEDAAEDVFPKSPSYLEDFQKNKNLMSLGLEFQIYAIRNPIFKKKFDRSKALNHEELAAGLKGIFARQKLVPPIDPYHMAIGFSALWDGFAIHGNSTGAKSVDHIIMVFLKALLDSAKSIKS